jgi:hypothetical protein
VLATPILVEREGRLEPLGRGYHERERLLTTKGELPFPVELGAAVRSLQDLLRDFLFPTPGDRSRALASVITPALTMGGPGLRAARYRGGDRAAKRKGLSPEAHPCRVR